MTDFSYIGKGKVYLREVGASAGRIAIGNCSKLDFAVSEETKELKDYTQGGGGTYNEVRRITGVEASCTIHDISAKNLSIALFGTESAITATTVSDEEETMYLGSLVKTSYIIDTAVDPVVEAKEGKNASARQNSHAYVLGDYYVPAVENGYFYKCTTAGTSNSSPPTFGTTLGGTTTDGTAVFTNMGKVTLVKDTDYTVAAAGIVILSGASVTDGQVALIDYTKDAASVLNALTSSAKEYEMVFDGLNEALSGKPVVVEAYRWKIGAAKNISFLGDDYAALEVAGKILKDTTKTGTGVSQYFKATMAT